MFVRIKNKIVQDLKNGLIKLKYGANIQRKILLKINKDLEFPNVTYKFYNFLN